VKLRVSPKTESEIRKSFPIHDRLAGWFFRVKEVSAGSYLAEGSDLYGRLVSRTGTDPDGLLVQCVADARSIQAQL
jgi:hypothetical protein